MKYYYLVYHKNNLITYFFLVGIYVLNSNINLAYCYSLYDKLLIRFSNEINESGELTHLNYTMRFIKKNEIWEKVESRKYAYEDAKDMFFFSPGYFQIF